MIEMTLTVDDPDGDGWQKVEFSDGDVAAKVVEVGQVRVVEGTEEGPTTWWDARVFDENDMPVERRFVSLEAAVLAMSLRAQSEDRDTRRLLGWS